MKTHFKYFLLAILIISLTASTSRAQMFHSNEAAVPYKSITSHTESTLERTAMVALRHITQARSDIHRKELIRARIELDKAEELIETIKDDLSTTTAKNFIWVARKHLEYEQSRQVLHDFAPIYTSLEMVSVYIPTDKAKLHVDRAKGYLEKDNKSEAEKELTLAEKSLIVIEVELPLLKTQRYINKAQEYLVENNPKKADEALIIAEQRATTLYFGMNTPLIRAKQNLLWAFKNYSTATPAETGTHLVQARNNLTMAEVGSNQKGKEEANKLSAELGELEKKLAGDGKVAESELKAAWERSEALAERSEAYLSADLSEAETTLGVENNLIEARLHVTYAETYQVTTSEPDKAVKELDIAYSYLHKAENNTLADSEDRKKMFEIGNIVLGLKLDPKERDITVRDRYETIKKDIKNLSGYETSRDQIREFRDL